MGQLRRRISKFEPAVFSIRIAGKLGEDWSEYFGAQSITFEVDQDGHGSTILISEPVDQAALIGMITHLNSLGLTVISVECLQTPAQNEPSQDDSCRDAS